MPERDFPTFTKYSGTEDPRQHALIFTDEATKLNKNKDLIARVVFKNLIKWDILLWYQELPNDNIKSFEDLTDIV